MISLVQKENKRQKDKAMTTQTITPELINSLSYYSLCKLADHLRVVNPKKVNVTGTITLDELGNYVSAKATYERPFH